jgi:hypothetical protein
MNNLTGYPLVVFALAFFLLWLSTQIGSSFLKRRRALGADVREDFGLIDSPRGGVIRVQPQNLLTFAQTLGKA